MRKGNQSMKKLLFMIDSLNGGGAEKVLINILKRIDYNKYNVTVFLIYGEGIYLNHVPDNVKIKYLTLGNTTINNWNFVKKNIYKLYRKILLGIINFLKGLPIYMFIIKDKYDIEISFLEGLTCLYVANSPNKTSKKISWIHIDLEKRRTLNPKDELKALSTMDRIICVSHGSKNSVLNMYPHLEDKIQVIYNPIDKEEIIRKSNEIIEFNKKKITVVNVGRLEYQKGQNILIQAHKELIDEGVEHELIIIGEGSLHKELEQLIENINIKNSVKLLGFISNPYPYVKAADIFALPSFYEGLPLVIAEALILAKPIIATKCTGPNEMLNNEYGIMVEPNNVQSLKDGMKLMILDKETREYYSKKSIERAEIFDIKKTMDSINRLLSDIENEK